jgi:hypothetical protein
MSAPTNAEMVARTPGPWEVDPRGGGCVRGSTVRQYARGENTLQVALAIGGADVDIEEVVANTHLIAAAPELLAALKAAPCCCHLDPSPPCEACNLSVAAIAKAEGR